MSHSSLSRSLRSLVRPRIYLRWQSSSFSECKVVPRKNAALQQVKAFGLSTLEATTREVAEKTRRSLFEGKKDRGPDPNQIREGEMILEMVCNALEEMLRKGDSTFCIRGEPVNFFDCEVNSNMRQAKIFWSLPHSLIKLPQELKHQVEEKMQYILEQRGSKLQYMVHTKLRHYYPPRLRFVAKRDVEMENLLLMGLENYESESEEK